MTARRLAWIETARTINCALVVLVHVNIYTRAGADTWWPGGFYSVPIFSLAVPSFMMIAGYIVDLQLTTNPTSATITSRLTRLAIPFFAWNVITLVVMHERSSLQHVVASVLTGAWHLYFIFALLQLLVIYAWRGRFNLAACAAITLVAYALLDASMWISGANLPIGEEVARKTFPLWIGFFAAGIRIRQTGVIRASPRAWIAISIGLIGAYALYVLELVAVDQTLGYVPLKQFLFGGLPFQFLGGFAMLAAVSSVAGTRIGLALSRVGRDTYGIYLSHVAIMILLYRALQSAGLIRVRPIEVGIVAIITFLTAWLFVRLVRALPLGRRLLLGEGR